jgi:hypothetical protein
MGRRFAVLKTVVRKDLWVRVEPPRVWWRLWYETRGGSLLGHPGLVTNSELSGPGRPDR